MWNYKKQHRIMLWSVVVFLCLAIAGGVLFEKIGPGLKNQAWVHTWLILLQERAASLSWLEHFALGFFFLAVTGIGFPAFPFILFLTPAFGPITTLAGVVAAESFLFLWMKYVARDTIAADDAEDAEIWARIGDKARGTAEMAFAMRLHLGFPQRYIDYFVLSAGGRNPSPGRIFLGTLFGQIVRMGLQVLWTWAAWKVWRGFQPFPEADLILLVIVTLTLLWLSIWRFAPELVFGGAALQCLTRMLAGLPEPPFDSPEKSEPAAGGRNPDRIEKKPTPVPPPAA